MNNKASSWLVIICVILAVLLVWGLIGGNAAQSVGTTCDIGFGQDHMLCWKWHTNVIGQIQEAISDLSSK